MLLKHERDRDKLEQAAGASAHKYSRGLNHLFLDPVREVAQCDFWRRGHFFRELMYDFSVVSGDKQH